MTIPTQMSELFSGDIKAKLEEYRAKIPKGISHEQLKVNAYNETEGSMKYLDCPKCKNKGQIAVLDSNGDMALRECECMKVRRLHRNLENSGLKGVYDKYTLESYKADHDWQKTIHSKALAYIDAVKQGQGYWLYVGGQRGSGKSHICCAVSGRLIGYGKTAVYKLWQDLAAEYKAKTYKEDERANFMYLLSSCELLYIDDFMKVRDKRSIDFHFDLAFQVLNARYNAKKPTVISSEWTIGELGIEDSAISGRITEMANKGEYVISIPKSPDKDYRQLKN